ncbi:hypothetical protein CDN99_03595 [Roseateles aquatilis]|uniref:N-acetyltransferase domain-containing protein n=1 Tax=Roseateles aquatilis TaxID=431061 RepID=A0A246JLP2_9BURK|nr:hypothetical protein CDN99_03595 [Roseateles aquatilis]
MVGNTQDMRVIVEQSRRMGWPMWVMNAPTDAGDAQGNATTARPPVAWAFLRPIAWAPEACSSTGDLWLYVSRDWQGSGIAMRMIRRVFRECRRHGFDAITCWILGSNRRSLSLVRACRLTRWGNLPAVVDYGGLRFDLEIWGCKLDDPVWLAHMDRLERRHARLDARRSV